MCFPSSMARARKLREIKNFVRNVFARETLEEAPPSPAPAGPQRQFTAMLFGSEPLSLDAEAAPLPRGSGLLRSLFAPEPLPEDPVEPPSGAGPGPLRVPFGAEALPEPPTQVPAPARPGGLLRALFAPEPLPELPAAAPRPRRSAWLRWLFGFERLGPP